DGVTDPETRAATKRFQRRHHLVPDGIAGPKTRAALGHWGRHELGRRELRPGRRGWDVAELQFLLRRNGISISLDGIFGPATEAAVVGSPRGGGPGTDGGVGPPDLGGPCGEDGGAGSAGSPSTRASAPRSTAGRATTASTSTSRVHLRGWSRGTSRI